MSDPVVDKYLANQNVPDSTAPVSTPLPEKSKDEVPSDTLTNNSRDPFTSSVFYKEVLVFLEGVQVPENSVTMSYGINTPATLSLVVPAHDLMRTLSPDTKIHVFFKDFVPNTEGKREWNLLFDGEKSAHGYQIVDSGASLSLHFIHAGAYFTMMPVVTMDAASFLTLPAGWIGGDAVMCVDPYSDATTASVISGVIKGGAFKSMADIVYRMVKSVLENNSNTGIGKYYYSKIGSGNTGFKLLDRIFNVSNEAKTVSTTPVSKPFSGSGGGASGGASGAGGGGVAGDTYSGGTWRWPSTGTITRGYSVTAVYHPVHGNKQPHFGIDIGGESGQPIIASKGGTVSLNEWDKGYGNWTIIDHGDGTQATYAHMSYPAMEPVGTKVKTGQLLGYMGSTGYSTGPHLHFGVQLNGQWVSPMDYLGDPGDKAEGVSAEAIRNREGREAPKVIQRAAPLPTRMKRAFVPAFKVEPEDAVTFILVNKSTNTLELRNGENVLSTYICGTGTLGVKRSNKDKATPLGIFKIVVSTPCDDWEYLDKETGKEIVGYYSGYYVLLGTAPYNGIGIQGTKNLELLGTNNTEGSILVSDENIRELKKHITNGMFVKVIE